MAAYVPKDPMNRNYAADHTAKLARKIYDLRAGIQSLEEKLAAANAEMDELMSQWATKDAQVRGTWEEPVGEHDANVVYTKKD